MVHCYDDLTIVDYLFRVPNRSHINISFLILQQVETQRVQYKRLPRIYDPATGLETGVKPNKRLNAERLQKLEAIGFAWSAKHIKKNTINNSDSTATTAKRRNSAGGRLENATATTADMELEVGPASSAFEENQNNSAGSSPAMGMSTNLQIQQQGQNNPRGKPQPQRRHRLNEAQWEGM